MPAWLAWALLLGAPDLGRAERDFSAANELALKGEHRAAVTLYESVLAQGIENEDVYLNLGHARAALGEQVPAIVAWERALRLRPGDADARANLELTRARLLSEEPAGQAESLALADVLEPASGWLPPPLGGVLLLAAELLFFAALYLLLRAERRRRGLRALVVALGVVAAILLLLRVSSWIVARDPRAVVLEATELREGPRVGFKSSGRAGAGARVRVLEEDSGWLKIQRRDGGTGWLPREKLTRV